MLKRVNTTKVLAVSVLIGVGSVLHSTALMADTLPSAPSASTAASVPATASAVPMRSIPRVEIFAFTSVNKQEPADWIGRGLQENLQSDVSRTGATLVLPPHAAPADDSITAARQDHADLAVVGTYQIVGDQLRVNAHLMDVTSNTAIGGFAATGAQRDLFKLEDALGEQLRRLLPRPVVADQSAPFQQAVAPAVQPSPTVVYQESPNVTYAPPPVANYYESAPAYYPDYDSGYYNGYGDPFFYGGIGFYGGGYGYYNGGGYYNRGYNGNRGIARGGVGFGGIRGGGVGGGFHAGVGGGFHGGGGGGGHR